MEVIIERLKKKGIVLTHQRLAVLRSLEGDNSHPTADDIYKKVKKKYPTISPATVYTSLEVLRQAGEIQELTIRREKVIFDSNPEPHHHFFCQKCNRIIDINIGCSEAEKGWIDGHKISGVQAYFYGICSDCLKEDISMNEQNEGIQPGSSND